MAKFNLDKSSDRQFDLSKGGKRKFDLSKDADEPIVSAPAPAVVTEGKTGSSKKWPLIIVVLAVAGALAWWLMPSSSTPEGKEATETPVEEVVATETEKTTEESPVVEISAEIPVSDSSEVPTRSEEPTVATASTPAVETPAPSAPVSGNIEAEALKVIRGEYGVGKDRMAKLGDQYSAIQTRVNQLKREGAF